MEFTWRTEKEQANIRKPGLDFSIAKQVGPGPLSDTRFNGVVNGEERWYTVGDGSLAGRVITVVVIHTDPDPDDDDWVHIISLREATAHERRQYQLSRR